MLTPILCAIDAWVEGEGPRGTRKRPKETLGSEPTGPTSADLVRAQTWHKWRSAFNSPWYLHIQPPTNKNNQYITTFAESVSHSLTVLVCVIVVWMLEMDITTEWKSSRQQWDCNSWLRLLLFFFSYFCLQTTRTVDCHVSFALLKVSQKII
jgi:hypothetical protein